MGKDLSKSTHMRKSSKPPTEEELLTSHITTALSISQTGRLLTLTELPPPWRINHFVLTGYTFAVSIPACLHNTLKLSNETFNIWSHAFGIVMVQYLALYHYPSTTIYAQSTNTDEWVMSLYFAASAVCLSCSVYWHTLKCHCDPHFMISCASVDLSGVTGVICAMNALTQYTAFACSPSAQKIYLVLTALCGTASLLLGWSPKFRHPDLAWVRVAVFTLLGIVGLLPMGHLSITRGWSYAWTFYKPVWRDVVAPIFSGAIVYASKMPERWWPRSFDFLGWSHHLWHVAVLVTIWGGYMVGLALFGVVLAERTSGCPASP